MLALVQVVFLDLTGEEPHNVFVTMVIGIITLYVLLVIIQNVELAQIYQPVSKLVNLHVLPAILMEIV
jgi:hypothetical protein